MQKLTVQIFVGVASLLFVSAVLLLAQNTAHAVTGGYIKIDDVKGESTTEAQMDSGTSSNDDERVFCTADAYQCPDGSWVGRAGPNCEFVCSGESVEKKEIEVIEYRNGDDRGQGAEPGMQVAPSQPRVILTPVAADGSISARGLAGIDIDVRDEDSDDDGLGDARASVFGAGGGSVRVDGATVRGWDAETKATVKARLAEADAQNDTNDFGLSVAMHAVDHIEIETIEVEDASATVAFTTTLRVFGVIPVRTTASATAKADGTVDTSYPWWSFLASRPEGERAGVFGDIAAGLAARIAIEEEGVPAVEEKHN